MLLQLRLVNFRQHRELKVDFTKGLNVIRGANERGKSTLLEGLSYVLFGISACRTPIEGMVTWGEAPNTLKASLDLEVEGTIYRITRSSRGAECRYGDGQTVTGQKEVTAFVGRLFGVDASNINNLLLAGQGDIRGALSKGSTKTAQLIEDLANFDVIDRVINLISERLLVGSPTPFEEKVSRLTPELAQCEDALANVPDTTAEEGELGILEPQLAELEASAAELVQSIEPAAAERDQLQALLQERARLVDRQRLLTGQAEAEAATLKKLQGEAPAPGTQFQPRLAAVQQLLADVDKVARLRVLRAEVAAIEYPEVYWDKPLEAFSAEVTRVKRRQGLVRSEHTRLSREEAGLRAQIITQTACGLCSKDLSQVPEVIEKNKAVADRLVVIRNDIELAERDLAEAQIAEETYAKIAVQQTYAERLAAKYGDLVTIDKAWVPWRFTWAGGELPDNDDGSALRAELAQLQAAITAYTVWQTRVQSQEKRVEQADAAALQACAWERDGRFVDLQRRLDDVLGKVAGMNASYSAVMAQVYEQKEYVAGLRSAVQLKRAAYDTAKVRVDVVREALAEAGRDLDAVNFNNALLKRVRTARPVIANKLWSMVLSPVSRYFSQMRSEESVVTKEADGFKVNGQPIEALSGSTLDLLGLAIRLALVRSFLPQSPFLILDEPSAACDTARTESMMGFLVSAGFDQMLIVTHEAMSEQVAENLIEI